MKKSTLKRMTSHTEFYIFIVLVVLCIAIHIVSGGNLLVPDKIFTILRAMISDGIFAMCCLVVMISGGFDLSFPAIASLAYALSTTICLNNGWCQSNPFAAFLMAIIFGMLLGMFNGWIIANFKLNTMLVTLGTQTFFNGLSVGVLQLKEITSALPQGLKNAGDAKLFTMTQMMGARQISSSLSANIIWLIVICAVTSFILNKTMFGRALYAIGGNEVSAERAGYNVKKTKFILYTAVGALSGFAGMLRVCLTSQSIPKALIGKEMTIIPAVILGGASIFGGEGTVFGSITAMAIITVVSNSMILIGIDSAWQDMFNGIIILIGITVSAVQAKRRAS
ncbi:MAG: ABC transporter permease [Eubacterium sp.]|nr:ABC transporter permease [Eubacterium sp.]